MQVPRIEGLRVKMTVGSGVSGTVYWAEDEHGTPLAVKVYQGMSINRALLTRTTYRLEFGGWPVGTMPITSASFDGRPALRVTKSYIDDDGQPSSLQHRLANYPSIDTWEIVRELSQALANMHDRQVAHCNLKPGNIFFSESGQLLLTDWSVGQMPGAGHIEYTDAFLYSPPEQLLNPEGYLDEAGYRWDVFAFGVISFRLLTGTFPRCHDTFSKVAPPPGETRRDGIIADTPKIAQSLSQHPHFTWPDDPQNKRELEYRELLNRCLSLQPLERPATMAEVSRSFAEIDQRIDTEEHRDLLLDQRRRADRRAWLWTAAAALLLGSSVLLAFMWFNTGNLLTKEKKDRIDENRDLKLSLNTAIENKAATEKKSAADVNTAVTDMKQAQETLRIERGHWLSKLEASRDNSDELFSWALDKNNVHLPLLDPNEVRLKRLESYYTDFLAKNKDIPELAEERASAMLQLAEISLTRNDPDTAASRLNDAITTWEPLEKSPHWLLRIASDKLILAMLKQRSGKTDAATAFADARTALAAVPTESIDLDRLKQLQAILHYEEAQIIAAAGNSAKALDQLRTATTQLNELIKARPDIMVLRSELSQCFLSSATILEGMNDLGNAREVRSMAATELETLLKAKPNDISLRLKLAETYTAMAHASLLAGDIASMDQLNKSASTILENIIRDEPNNRNAAAELAAHRYFRAILLEDAGDSAKARTLVDDGLRLLEFVATEQNTDPIAQYYRALLQWQSGRITGINDRVKEIALEEEARKLFIGLKDKKHNYLRNEHVLMNLAQLLGDMAHAAQVSKDKPSAKKYFQEALTEWQALLALQPKNQQYQSALQWCKDRLSDL